MKWKRYQKEVFIEEVIPGLKFLKWIGFSPPKIEYHFVIVFSLYLPPSCTTLTSHLAPAQGFTQVSLQCSLLCTPHSAKCYLLLPRLVLLHYYNEDSSNMLKSSWVWAAGDWHTFRTPQGFNNPCWLTSFAFLLPTLLFCRKHIVTCTNTFLCASRSFSSEMRGLAWLLFSPSDWC